MHFPPTLRYFHKNNARNINYMTVLIFLKNLDLRINAYSRTASWTISFSDKRTGGSQVINGSFGCRS